jgi:DNA-directed RNA polymerase subunit RPC12/RpoP
VDTASMEEDGVEGAGDAVGTGGMTSSTYSLLHQPASCQVCQKTFANIYRLQRHMISHEESQELRRFRCPDCDKAFKFKHHLKVSQCDINVTMALDNRPT